MDKPTFVYVSYIKSTAEKVWRALTDGEISRRYWSNQRNVSDWKTGSPWRHEDYDNPANIDIVGTVIESDPPRRLVVTWAVPKEATDPAKQSRVTYDIAEDGGLVRLTVTHDELERGGMEQGIREGWPHVLSSLKTLLETGEVMPSPWTREDGKWKKTLFEENA